MKQEKINWIIKDSRNLFELKNEEDYYKLISSCDYYSNSYIEYEINSDKIKNSQLVLNKIRPFFKDVITNLKKVNT